MIFWQNDIVAKKDFGKNGKITHWQNDIVAKNILAKSYLGIHTARFPNNHTVQSKRFCELVHEIAAV